MSFTRTFLSSINLSIWICFQIATFICFRQIRAIESRLPNESAMMGLQRAATTDEAGTFLRDLKPVVPVALEALQMDAYLICCYTTSLIALALYLAQLRKKADRSVWPFLRLAPMLALTAACLDFYENELLTRMLTTTEDPASFTQVVSRTYYASTAKFSLLAIVIVLEMIGLFGCIRIIWQGKLRFSSAFMN